MIAKTLDLRVPKITRTNEDRVYPQVGKNDGIVSIFHIKNQGVSWIMLNYV